jgi:hypothetical protein
VTFYLYFNNNRDYLIKDFMLYLNEKSTIMVATLKQGASKAYIAKLLKRISNEIVRKGVDTSKFCGKLSLKEEPLTIQRRLRDEW